MKKWLKWILGALGIALTWAAGWSVVGTVLWWVASLLILDGTPATDRGVVPFTFGLVGFVSGATFSMVLGLAAWRRGFHQMSLTRFAAWGAAGGALLSILVLIAESGQIGLGELIFLGLLPLNGGWLGRWFTCTGPKDGRQRTAGRRLAFQVAASHPDRQRHDHALTVEGAVMRYRYLLPQIAIALSWAVSAASQEPRKETFELTTATIADINAAFDSGVLTSERLVELSLARIAAFDDAGPQLNAVLALNRNALAEARALDAERARSGPRSPLHGIPVILKDNFDTHDMPTTGGSFVLAGSLPPDDAFLVQKLRDAGAVILAKTNMSEFASGGTLSSIGGMTLNPHDLVRSPSGSSSGSGVGIAAVYAPLGLGTDTGGSVRGPASANGIVGLRPTYGLLSRDGIIPLGLSFDMAGPMARHVYDVAVSLGVLAGVDPADGATARAAGRVERDYTAYLDVDALAGARIGVARQFLGRDGDVDWIVETSLEAMRASGATIVDVEFPEWLLRSRVDLYWTVRLPEFKPQMGAYLATLGDDYPKTVEELYRRSTMLTSPSPEGYIPNASRWNLLKDEVEAGTLNDYDYLAVRNHGLPLIRDMVAGLFEENGLDAIVYPTSPTRPARVDVDPTPPVFGGSATSTTGLGSSVTNIASLAGLPALAVPAGFTTSGLPVTLSFLGRAFSEPRLLALGYAFEQRTQARRLPRHTPPLPGETLPH